MQTILFLCQHGGAKSVIAASYFNRLMQERGLPFRGEAAAAEEPYDAVPGPVVALLDREGVDVRGFTPRRVAENDVQRAARVVGIGCDASERWNDVPPAGEDLEGCADAIRRRVETLAAEL